MFNKYIQERKKESPVIQTLLLGARPAIRAAAAFPALFSSMKLIVELIMRSTMIPMKSCQSGGLPYNMFQTILISLIMLMLHCVLNRDNNIQQMKLNHKF